MWLMVRKQAIDKQGVEDDDDEWESTGDAEGVRHGNAFMYGVRILDGDVIEGEVLVKGLDRVENREASNAGTVSMVSTESRDELMHVHNDHIVKDVAEELLVGFAGRPGESRHTR